MNQDTFEPKNELEKQLQCALDGSVSGDDFMRYLMDAQVFMPVEDEANQIKGFQRSTRAQPLVLEDETGTRVLVLFTSPERAKAFVENHPGYGGGLLTEFAWVLRKMGAPAGIALNPGLDAGFDLEPEMVADLMASLPPEA
ncbi:SseB family protein [Sulfuriferula plumbiphila]|nr:SseB family protein [Sulfuriferula plumbiphila]